MPHNEPYRDSLLDSYMTEAECADELGVKVTTLRTWRSRFKGPMGWAKIGRKVVYRRSIVKRWLERQESTSVPVIRRVGVRKLPRSIRIYWKNDGLDVIDLTSIIARFKVFAPLKDAAEFATVHVVQGGMGIAWDCGLDLSSSTLEDMARDQKG